MSDLYQKVEQELVLAMKEKNELKVSTLRMLIAALKNKKIELQKELTDTDVIAVIQKLVKQRKDSIESYTEGGREELAQKEAEEIEFLKKYLPEEMSKEELDAIIDDVISEVGAKSMADMGKVMGAVMQKVSGRADGNVVKERVQSKLS